MQRMWFNKITHAKQGKTSESEIKHTTFYKEEFILKKKKLNPKKFIKHLKFNDNFQEHYTNKFSKHLNAVEEIPHGHNNV